MTDPGKQTNNSVLYRYIGLTTQIMVSLGIAVFVGIKIDKWIDIKFPLLVWVLPLLVISLIIWKIIKETSKK